MKRTTIADKLGEIAAAIKQRGSANLTRLTVIKKWCFIAQSSGRFPADFDLLTVVDCAAFDVVAVGHVGNALALSIMSTAMLRFRVVEFARRQCLAHIWSGQQRKGRKAELPIAQAACRSGS